MNLDVQQLIAAMPADEDRDLTTEEALRQLLAGMSAKPVPVSRLARLWTVSSMQAKVAMAYFAYWLRSGFAGRDEKERLLNETHLKAALKVVGSMSYLRGVLMKAGQYLASYPNIIPEQFVEALSSMCFEAPPMHFALLREHVRNELGGNPDELFAEFEHKAFAAASLGQVHRAKLKTGQDVAVKIQYPNIARTIQADYRNIMAIITPMRLSKDWDNIRAQWEEIRWMVEAETDYCREASFLKRAAAVFRPEDGILVPKVYDDFCSPRVLTMDYVDGVHLNDFLAGDPTQGQRDRAGYLVMLASWRIAHTAKFWYSDSNQGNYIFMPDGRLGLIDFGCVREFNDDEWDFYKRMGRGQLSKGEDYTWALKRSAALDPDEEADPDHLRFLDEFADWWGAYVLREGPFDFGDEAFIQRGIELFSQIPKKRYFRCLPMTIWISRHLLGIRGLLYKLGAHVDVHSMMRQESKGIFV